MKMPGKNIIGGLLIGTVIGSILFLIAAGLNAVLAIWAFPVEIVFFLVGFTASIGYAYLEDADEDK